VEDALAPMPGASGSNDAAWAKEDAHFERWATMEDGQARAFDYLYGRLAIIDSKVASLLTFDSLLIAAVTIVVQSDHYLDLLDRVLLLLVGSALLSSTVMCLLMCGLKWEYLAPENVAESGTGGGLTTGDYRRRIIGVTRRRTARYNLACDCTLLAVILGGAMVGVRLFDRSGQEAKPPDGACLSRSTSHMEVGRQHVLVGRRDGSPVPGDGVVGRGEGGPAGPAVLIPGASPSAAPTAAAPTAPSARPDTRTRSLRSRA
jgi:hypothetical protein